MKRVLTFLAIMLLPLSVMAMTPISDVELGDVTGQSGVSINMDLTMDIAFDQMGWGDSDGLVVGGTQLTAGGWIGLDSFYMDNLHIWPRTDMTMDNLGSVDYDWSDLQFLTIDVITVTDSVPWFGTYSTYSAVRIGVPTLTITMDEMAGNVVLGGYGVSNTVGGEINGTFVAEKAIGTPAFDQLMGKFLITGLNMAMDKDGYVTIGAHGNGTAPGAVGNTLHGSGVTFNLANVAIDYMLLDTVAWGDIEGVYDMSLIDTTKTTAGLQGEGWIGLADMAIDDLVFNGKIAIDVCTVLTDSANNADVISGTPTTLDYTDLVICYDDIYDALGKGGDSFVSIGIVDGFTVTMGQFGAEVQLGQTGLLDSTQKMGDIYASGMTFTMNANQVTGTQSHIHIFAH